MKIIVFGACGRMGKELIEIIEKTEGMSVAARVDAFGGEFERLSDFQGDADVVIDFSNHLLTEALCRDAAEKKLPLVIATTAHTEAEKQIIYNTAEEIPVFYSANMSVGIALLASFARKAAAAFPDADIEIVEKHHNRKLDAPSGTALLLADEIRQSRPKSQYVTGRAGNTKREPGEIGIHAVRAGNIVGDHEIIICTDSQTLTLSHSAHTRALFAEGALEAAKFIAGNTAGLYGMKDLLK